MLRIPAVMRYVRCRCMAKLGVIAENHVPAYEEYVRRLRAEFKEVVQLDSHHGFAMAVHEGLRMCSTDYCLILQHDRSFCRPVVNLEQILQIMDGDESIRYVGFNTFKSARHDRVLEERYGLLGTMSQLSKEISSDYSLFPLIFWYDSNHIAHVRRYLEIYQPFRYAPQIVKDHFDGLSGVKKMLLRPGDFIEDRLPLHS